MSWESEDEKDDKFPTLHKNNIDAWNSLTYGWIIKGMMESEDDLQYGRAMTLANNLTERLFKDVRTVYNLETPGDLFIIKRAIMTGLFISTLFLSGFFAALLL